MRSSSPLPLVALALLVGLEVLLVPTALKLLDFGIPVVLVIAVLVGLGTVNLFVPRIGQIFRRHEKPKYLHELSPVEVSKLSAKEHLDALNNARMMRLQKISTLGVILGGAFTVGTLIFTFQGLQNSVREQTTAQQGQITDRYTKAVEQLASNKPEVRLGGVYALERVALDSPRDHQTIYNVLAAFIRENDPPSGAKPSSQPNTDIQATLTVIGRRAPQLVNYKLDLTDIRAPEAVLDNAVLIKTSLSGADLNSASLSGANLSDSILDNAHLGGAKLTRATLINAQMNFVHLDKADLSMANLRNADLESADLEQADLTKADLRGADLRMAKGINLREIRATAIIDSTTKF